MKRYTTYNPFVDENFKDIYDNYPIRHRVLNKIPKVNDLKEGEIVFCVTDTIVRLYTKLKGVIRYINLI